MPQALHSDSRVEAQEHDKVVEPFERRCPFDGGSRQHPVTRGGTVPKQQRQPVVSGTARDERRVGRHPEESVGVRVG
jgi:hypothetical protein